MKINILKSSSDGNATHVFTEKTSLLVEAGISAKQVVETSGTEDFDAILISHEHGDHAGGAGVTGRRTGAPIYVHPLVYEKIKNTLGGCEVHLWEPGETFTFGDLRIENFSTRHDSLYSYGFVISNLTHQTKLCYLPDTGSWTKLMLKKMANCDGYILDTDYDEQGLRDYEEYDDFLKERIRSNWGHLSNQQVMKLLSDLEIKNPQFIILAHLSENTNSPKQALRVAEEHYEELVKTGVISTVPVSQILTLE